MLKAMADKVLIVGAGMTGAAVACFFRQSLQKSASIWDKSLGTGGRMSTSRCNKDSRSTVDLGAQYISATPDFQEKHAKEYKDLVDANVLQELTGTIQGHQDKIKGTKHYVTPAGCSSLVKHYLNKADAKLSREHLVKDVSIESGKVKVTTDKGVSDLFDAVVLTMPVPQILQLQGDIQKMIDNRNVRKQLEAVSYSSRFAVGLFFNPGTVLDYDWSAQYVTDNPCIRFISIDNKKRGKESSEIGPSICVHTGAPWGLENVERDKDDVATEILTHLRTVLPALPEPLEVKESSDIGPSICVHTGAPWGLENVERDKDEVATEILTHLRTVLPAHPEPLEVKESSEIGPSICVHTGAPWGLENVERDKDEVATEILTHLRMVLPELPEPLEVKGHKWRYSQVHKGYPGSPGCIVLSEEPAVILAGDAFVHSNFDGCIDSALSVIKSLENIQTSKVKL